MIVFDHNLKIYYSSLINENSYFAGFSTKTLGDGRSINMVSDFFNRNNIEYKRVVVMEQIHSANIEFYSDLLQAEGPLKNSNKNMMISETDGVITQDNNVVLTIQTADCVPAVFTDRNSGTIGIAHLGWRGTLKKLQVKMIDEMIEQGSEIEDIKIAFGPAINDCCYDIRDDLYYSFREEFDQYSDQIFTVRGGKRYLNLTLLNYLLLTDRGIKKNSIDFFPFCTKCDKNKFFSFRREGKNLEGKMFSFVMKRSNA